MGVRSGYKQSEIGVIPIDWEAPPVETFAAFASGKGIKVSSLSEMSSDFPIPVFGGNGIAGYTSEALIAEPTVIVGRVGQKCGEVYLTEGPAWITDNALYPRSIRQPVNMHFLALALKAAGLNDQKNRNDLPLVTQSIVHALRVAWPPTSAEQNAIVKAINDMEALQDRLEHLLAKKRDIKQAAMQQLLTGQTRLPGFYEKWPVKRLEDAVEKFVGGGTPSRANSSYWNGRIPWVTVKDFATFNPLQAQEYITEEGLTNSASNLIPAGTVITSTRMALGKAVIYEMDVAINQDLKALFLTNDSDTFFMRYWFEFNARIIDSVGGGSTVKGISLPQLRSIVFFAPPTKKEQGAIAQVLLDMEDEIDRLNQRLAKTRDLKQAMMQELLTGKTRLVTSEATHA